MDFLHCRIILIEGVVLQQQIRVLPLFSNEKFRRGGTLYPATAGLALIVSGELQRKQHLRENWWSVLALADRTHLHDKSVIELLSCIVGGGGHALAVATTLHPRGVAELSKVPLQHICT